MILGKKKMFNAIRVGNILWRWEVAAREFIFCQLCWNMVLSEAKKDLMSSLEDKDRVNGGV